MYGKQGYDSSSLAMTSSAESAALLNNDETMTHFATYGHTTLNLQESSVDSASVKVPILREGEMTSRWPVLLWFYLKTLGLYHSGRLVRSKVCAKCKKAKKHNTYRYTEGLCKVCDSLMWDYRGVSTEITDRDIGSSFFNHCGSGLLSLLWLLLITGVTVANIVLLITSYDSDECDIVHVLAWIGVKLLLYIGPFTCLISVIHTTWPTVFMGSWSNALAVEFVVHRLRFVNMKEKQFAGYAIFLISIAIVSSQCIKLAAPYFDPVLVSPILANQTVSGFTTLVPLHFFVVIEGYVNFGGFCYLVYLLRCSYESEIRLVTKFLRHNIKDTDLCRSRLAEAFDAYHIFREFSSGWIALNLILCTVCLLLELHIWIVKTEPLAFFQYEHTFLLFFFLLFPIVSLGNVDVDYLWNRLVRQISRQRTTCQEQYWEKLMQFLQEQKAGSRPWQSVLAFFLSTIAIFSAIQFRLWSFDKQTPINVYTVMANGSLGLMQTYNGS